MIAAVRVRGGINIRGEVEDTLHMLGLKRINSCALLPETESVKGMLQKSKDFVTWGEADPEVISELIEKRGEKKMSKPIDTVVKGIMDGSAKFSDFGLKKTFRLSPPSKGYERGGIKKSYSIGGALGYRGKEINSLLVRMI